MKDEVVIRVAEQFGRQPYGRRADDGAQNGEAFRHRILIPALRDANRLVIEMDGNETPYGSSFLDEAFGGLIRYGFFTHEQLAGRIIAHHKLKNIPDRISYYIKIAIRDRDPETEARLLTEYGG